MRSAILLVTTIFTTALLYAPQPLLPLFKAQFLLRESTAGLLVSLTLAPLSLAPLCYGFFLELVPVLTLLRISLFLLAMSALFFAACQTFPLLLAARILQGLIIPAVLTSIMTGMAIYTPRPKLQRVMSFYIASTITGGVLGRLFSGFLSTYFGWRIFFIVLACGLFLCFAAICKMKDSQEKSATSPKVVEIGQILKDSQYRPLFIIVLCVFFVLAAVMNFIPFRVLQINPDASSLMLGFVYTGYVAGIFSALAAPRIIRQVKCEEKTIIVGIFIMAFSLLVLLIPSLVVVFLILFVLSGSMFLVHAVNANKVNQMANEKKGIVNGVYIAAYYTGGTFGSYFPGLVYEKLGWSAFIGFLGLILAVGLYNILVFQKRLPGQKKI